MSMQQPSTAGSMYVYVVVDRVMLDKKKPDPYLSCVLQVARVRSLSFGETTLTAERWQQTLDLESNRISRMQS